MTELFPDMAEEARRKRHEALRQKRADAQARLDALPEDWQKFILRCLREYGPGNPLLVWGQLDKVAGKRVLMTTKARFLQMMWDMSEVGILWRYNPNEEVLMYGIRGEHRKSDFVAMWKPELAGDTL